MWNLSSALLGEGKPLWGDDLELPNPHTPLITASQKPLRGDTKPSIKSAPPGMLEEFSGFETFPVCQRLLEGAGIQQGEGAVPTH